tara:strand:+ start:1419 stop:1601 length:183 start_codon:yes stop_codon:yes gene_type:complete
MAKNYGINKLPQSKKKTIQGNGAYTKKSHSGGETFYGNRRAGSPPGAQHRRKKAYKGQGR